MKFLERRKRGKMEAEENEEKNEAYFSSHHHLDIPSLLGWYHWYGSRSNRCQNCRDKFVACQRRFYYPAWLLTRHSKSLSSVLRVFHSVHGCNSNIAPGDDYYRQSNLSIFRSRVGCVLANIVSTSLKAPIYDARLRYSLNFTHVYI